MAFGDLIEESLVGLGGLETKVVDDVGADCIEKVWEGHVA